jgi:cobalt-zinc-cadmium efflux system membrane fusion protein
MNHIIFNKISRAILPLMIAGIFLFPSCSGKTQSAKESAPPQNDSDRVVLTQAQLKNANLECARLSERSLSTVLRLNGRIDVPPQSLISVSVSLGGYLKSSTLLPGMQVKKGAVIAVMEDPKYVQLQQDFLQVKARMQFAESDYNRQKDLNAEQASSDKATQAALAERDALRVQLAALGQQLRLINIDPDRLYPQSLTKSIVLRSPINGFVSKVNVNVGKYVNPADVLFELIDPTDIHLNLKVYEKDVASLKIGQKVQAYTNAAPDEKHMAEIILISRDINAQGISEVHCHFDQYDHNLLPGMYMNAEVEIAGVRTHTVPTDAVVSYQGEDFVFVKEAARQFRMVPVTTGASDASGIELLNYESLQGKELVIRNAYTLLMQLKNTPEEEE